ncbi:MAG: hypothetical protein AAFZ15_14130 [Bacteroidota bacterium]
MKKIKVKNSIYAAGKTASRAKQNFGLQQEEFETMLEKMKQGDESLFETVFLAHFEHCMHFLINHRNIHPSAAYDATMDAMLKFRKLLLTGKISYGNMRYLFTRMASQLATDNKQPVTTPITELNNSVAEELDLDDDILNIIDKAWEQLCQDCSNLLKNFYYHKIALTTIAAQQKISEASIRKRKQRCLEKLRVSFMKFYNI